MPHKLVPCDAYGGMTDTSFNSNIASMRIVGYANSNLNKHGVFTSMPFVQTAGMM